MTLRQVLAVLRARWYWALAAMLLCLGAGTGLSMTMLKRYTATASVMLDARSPDQVAGGAPSSWLPAGYMSSQTDLIASERVGRAVIRDLELAKDPGWREGWAQVENPAADYEAWMAEALSKGLTVKPAPASNILTLTYTSEDPFVATKLANAYVKAYVETSLEMRTERVRQFGGFFDARAKELRTDLDSAQAKLSDYQQKNGVLVGDERLNIESARLAELSSQLLAAQTVSAEASARLRQARRADELPEVWKNPSVAALDADVTREEVKLRELLARLGESHPQLIEHQSRLAELKTRLAAEKSRAVGNVGFDNSATQSRAAQISAALEAQRGKVLRLQAHREQSMTLQREVESAQRSYDAMQQRVNQAGVESQNTYTNVTVLKQATLPVAPSSPNLLKNMAASLIAGLLLGLGMVVGWEQLDRRMRTNDDVTELKQAMLVELPVSSHGRRVATDTSRTRQMKQRVLTGLPRPTPSA